MYKVKEVAGLVGVSVRTLHHYDRIGLLKPESVSPAGYRLYTEKDLEGLQQVLFFRELEFSLQEIKDIVGNPEFDRKHTLKVHKQMLIKKKERLEEIIKTVEKTILSIEEGTDMNKKEMFGAFNMEEIERHKEKYAEETRQKYGHTDAYKESQKKAAGYGKDDWAKISAESGAIYSALAGNMDKGPAAAEVQQSIGEWRKLITRYFYDCTPEILRGLGDLYVEDERFTANIDKYKPGLAGFMREAMHIYCDKLEQ